VQNGKRTFHYDPGLNPKHEIPAFAPQGGASRRQAKVETSNDQILEVPNTKV
jgi:hypothetical protein